MAEILIDVIIPTWNSAKTLEMTLVSIEQFLKPANIIIVDRDSKDSTHIIAENHHAMIISDVVSLGSARQKGIYTSQSEFIAFIDDDVVIEEGFRDKMLSYFSNDVGAVQGLAVGRLFNRIKFEPYGLKIGDRGYTNATIIKRDLIKDVMISDMNAYEDWVIAQHVIKKGFIWEVVPVYALHNHQSQSTYRHAAWNYAGIWRLASTGRMGMIETLSFFIKTSFKQVGQIVISDVYKGTRPLIEIILGILLSPFYLIRHLKR